MTRLWYGQLASTTANPPDPSGLPNLMVVRLKIQLVQSRTKIPQQKSLKVGVGHGLPFPLLLQIEQIPKNLTDGGFIQQVEIILDGIAQ